MFCGLLDKNNAHLERGGGESIEMSQRKSNAKKTAKKKNKKEKENTIV